MNENMKKLFQQSSIHKNIVLRFPGSGINPIDNNGIYKDSLSLIESISDRKSLVFGTCTSSKFEITIDNTPEVVSGIPMTVSIQIEEYEYQLFSGIIDSVKVQSDKRYKKIIAYDALYKVGSVDVSSWYNGLSFPIKLKAFRNSLFSHLGIIQEASELVNDEMLIERTIDPESLYALTVIESICEINGAFGHVSGNGIFRYILLKDEGEQIYPSNTLFPRNDLFPNEVDRESIKGANYETCIFEDYTVKKINKLQIHQEENDIGIIIGDGDNPYIIEDNFLVYGKTHAQLQPIAEAVYGIINNIEYIPCKIDMQGLPYLQVGDQVKVYTNKSIFNTFILKRKLSGIQALKDAIDIKGEELYGNEVKSLHEQIIQLKGKTNVLTRTVEETKSEIRDVEAGLTSSITQTAGKIETEVTRATGAEASLSTRITQTSNSITAEVTRATREEGNLSSRITQTENNISLKVSKNNIVSEINQTSESIKIRADKIDLNGFVTMSSLQTSGQTLINGDNITTGKISLDRLALTGYSGSSWEVKWRRIYAFNGNLNFSARYYADAGGYVLTSVPMGTSLFWVLSA